MKILVRLFNYIMMLIKLQIISIYLFFSKTKCELCDKFGGLTDSRICTDCEEDKEFIPYKFGGLIKKILQTSIPLISTLITYYRTGGSSKLVRWYMPCYEDHCVNIKEFWKYPMRESKLQAYLAEHSIKYPNIEMHSITKRGRILRRIGNTFFDE